MRPLEILRAAREHVGEITGQPVESVSGLSRDGEDDGTWTVYVEVLELRRVPDTMDLLASYEVELTDDGELVGFQRRRRYHRAAEDDRG